MDAARRARLLGAGVALLLFVLAVVRVVSTYGVFSQTVDEPLHIAAGYQWLTTDHYDLDVEHPPLARIPFLVQTADWQPRLRSAQQTGKGWALRVPAAKQRFAIDHLWLSYFGSADPRRLGIEAEELPPRTRVRGWIAVSEMKMRFGSGASRDDYAWLNDYRPKARIGRSPRLYYVP